MTSHKRITIIVQAYYHNHHFFARKGFSKEKERSDPKPETINPVPNVADFFFRVTSTILIALSFSGDLFFRKKSAGALF